VKYKIKIFPSAISDIQEIADWYDHQQGGVGDRFRETTIDLIDNLEKSPHIFSVRYNEIRCMLVTGFPYLVHYHIDELTKTVEILAVISTGRNPKLWKKKTKL
jgi:plasmid stabilization system protein ParE